MVARVWCRVNDCEHRNTKKKKTIEGEVYFECTKAQTDSVLKHGVDGFCESYRSKLGRPWPRVEAVTPGELHEALEEALGE